MRLVLQHWLVVHYQIHCLQTRLQAELGVRTHQAEVQVMWLILALGQVQLLLQVPTLLVDQCYQVLKIEYAVLEWALQRQQRLQRVPFPIHPKLEQRTSLPLHLGQLHHWLGLLLQLAPLLQAQAHQREETKTKRQRHLDPISRVSWHWKQQD